MTGKFNLVSQIYCTLLMGEPLTICNTQLSYLSSETVINNCKRKPTLSDG